LSIVTDNYPVYYFASRLAGDAADVSFPVPHGEDPAYWQPDRAAVQKYQDASLILFNGAGYAQWAATASLPQEKVVDTSRGFEGEFLQQQDAVAHSHGPEGEHTHAGIDFNTWLDPTLAMRHVEAIRAALVQRTPENQKAIDAEAQTLTAELLQLDAQLKAVGESLGGRPLFASHPVYNYLARRYAWNLKSMHWEPGEAPDEAGWQAFDGLRAEHPAGVMLWEDDLHPVNAAMLEERHIVPVVFRTCANTPPTGDYVKEMNANIARLADAIRDSSAVAAPAPPTTPGGATPLELMEDVPEPPATPGE
jgi:zinc transport system substrate-binding protein